MVIGIDLLHLCDGSLDVSKRTAALDVVIFSKSKDFILHDGTQCWVVLNNGLSKF